MRKPPVPGLDSVAISTFKIVGPRRPLLIAPLSVVVEKHSIRVHRVTGTAAKFRLPRAHWGKVSNDIGELIEFGFRILNCYLAVKGVAVSFQVGF